jgi:hypothetical protein
MGSQRFQLLDIEIGQAGGHRREIDNGGAHLSATDHNVATEQRQRVLRLRKHNAMENIQALPGLGQLQVQFAKGIPLVAAVFNLQFLTL